MRSQTLAVHDFYSLAYFQDNGSIRSSLVISAQFGRKEGGRLSRPTMTIIRIKEICACKLWEWSMRFGFMVDV